MSSVGILTAEAFMEFGFDNESPSESVFRKMDGVVHGGIER